MSYQLFAFQLAEPITGPIGLDGSYDPQSQTSTWESDGTVLASTKVKCSQWYQAGVCCSKYGSYCNNYGCSSYPPMICDNLG